MPRRRIFNTLINFDVAVLAFLFLDFILGFCLDPITTLLAFTSWTSIGNSNWYILSFLFVIFVHGSGSNLARVGQLIFYWLSHISFYSIRNQTLFGIIHYFLSPQVFFILSSNRRLNLLSIKGIGSSCLLAFQSSFPSTPKTMPSTD